MQNHTGTRLLKATAAAAAVTATAAVAAHATEAPRIGIIGSGYGGAVAALRLGQAGKKVDIIEMGMDWGKMAPVNGKVFTKMTSPSARSMWFKNRTQMPFGRLFDIPLVDRAIPRGAGVLDVENYGFMNVYLGRGVGGGSLVNGGMAVTPSPSYFSKILPQLDAEEMFSTYFPLANAGLGVENPQKDIIATSKFYHFTRTSVQQAVKSGYQTAYVPNVYDWDYMRQENFKNVTRSALDGEVIFGNNHGKKTLPKTILKDALATGNVNIIAQTEVLSIQKNPNGTFTLDTKTIDFDGNTLQERTFEYDHLIMAAGTMGTNKLLMRAKNEGTIQGLPEETGKKWGPNGNIMAARNMNATTGTYQSGIPAMGIHNWDDSEASVFAEVAPFPAGIDLRIGLYLAITNNPNLGDFTWDETQKTVGLNWTSEMAEPSVRAAKAFLDKLNTDNRGTSYRNDLFEGNKVFSDYFSYHPLGGMIIGEATDLNGEVKGVPNLYVMDGSLIPGRIGVNPFVTITAIAERNMDKLLTAKKFG